MVQKGIYAALFIAAGALMIKKPELYWRLRERWKSDGAKGPSNNYEDGLRLCGMLCVAMGIIQLALLLVPES